MIRLPLRPAQVSGAAERVEVPLLIRCETVDFRQTILSIPAALPQLIWPFIPYGFVLMSFAGFVFWNGGIVLGVISQLSTSACPLTLSM